MPSASAITIAETLALLDGDHTGLANGVSQGQYMLWLGSGISRDRIIGLDGVLTKLLDFMRGHVTAVPGCRYRAAFDEVIGFADLSDAERLTIDLTQPVDSWGCRKNLLNRLINKYSSVLNVRVAGEAPDHLLWDGLDFVHSFAAQPPSTEHLAIAMLVLEGAVSELASANWDGLLEAAMAELGHPPDYYRSTVTGEDLRGPAQAARLYKFHGCALRAIADEAGYRTLLIARSRQILDWQGNERFQIVRNQLVALLQVKHILMVGLSAQDANIQNLFVQARQGGPWAANDPSPPVMFSGSTISEDQKNILHAVYGNDAYEGDEDAIDERSFVPVYGKQLLVALLLDVYARKLQTLADDAVAAKLQQADRAAIRTGIVALRDQAAIGAEADRTRAAHIIAAIASRARRQLSDGESPDGALPYYPLDTQPAHQMQGKQALAATGLREAATALGLIGLEQQAKSWALGVQDPAARRSAAVTITSPMGSARVYFAATDATISGLVHEDALREDDKDAIVICSRTPRERPQRNPSMQKRDGTIGFRTVDMEALLASSEDIATLRDAFRNGCSL